jgi:hypothetical protein
VANIEMLLKQIAVALTTEKPGMESIRAKHVREK